MPTRARKNSSISNVVDSAEPMVAIDQTRIPAKITFRGPMRSAIGPEIREARAKTPRLMEASSPTWNFDSPKAASMYGVMPYTTCRSR